MELREILKVVQYSPPTRFTDEETVVQRRKETAQGTQSGPEVSALLSLLLCLSPFLSPFLFPPFENMSHPSVVLNNPSLQHNSGLLSPNDILLPEHDFSGRATSICSENSSEYTGQTQPLGLFLLVLINPTLVQITPNDFFPYLTFIKVDSKFTCVPMLPDILFLKKKKSIFQLSKVIYIYIVIKHSSITEIINVGNKTPPTPSLILKR